MNILVTGATGFVGRHLMRRLASRGCKLRCLVRRSSQRIDRLADLDAEIRHGDVTDAGSVKDAAEGCDAVYSLVGLLYEPKGYTFDAVHAGGVKNIVDACKTAGVRRLIHVSALGTSPDAESAYHGTKWAGEEAIRRSGLEYTIFRPSVIFGEDDSFVNLFAPLIRFSPVIGIIGDGCYKMQPVYIEDLVTCMVAALDDERTYGETFEIGGGEALTFNGIVDAMAEALGKRRLKLHIPVPLARLAATFLQHLPRPPLTVDQLKMLLSDNVCDNGKVEAAFGIDPVKFSEEVKRLLTS